MKDKVYTLTCTWASSYGAVLQAYALAKKINNLGYEAKIINYQPAYAMPQKAIGILKPAYLAKDYLFNRLYMNFLSDSGMITGRIYRSLDDLNRYKIAASAYIVGSDQVWNCTKYYNGKDDVMFLDFAEQGAKRISYAASLAMPRVPEDQSKRYKNLLDKFDAVSVREKTGADALSVIGVDAVRTVIDPVYLLTKEDWGTLAAKSHKDFSEKYVLIICLEERDSMYEYARKKADMLGVKLFSFRGGIKDLIPRSDVDKSFWNISVYDYLNIVKNAESVVADSFHAMSFSLIFNRDIDIIPRNDSGNSRMIDLLTDLGITERVVLTEDVLTDKIDFVSVTRKITEKVKYASIFLRESIEGQVVEK